MASVLWFTVVGWLVSPIISFFVNKLLSYLDFHLSRKLQELKYKIIPSLEEILGDVTERRILRAAKDEGKGYESYLKNLSELEKDLKIELYDIVDVMDLIEYRRIEKKVIGGDRKSVSTSISSWVLQAIGDCVACCKRSSFGQKLRQCAQNQNQKLGDLGAKLQHCAQDLDLKFWDLVATLQQYAQNLNQMFREPPQSLPVYIHQRGAGQPSPTPDAPAAEVRGGNQHGSAEEAATLDAHKNSLVQMICDWLVYGFSALRSFHLAAHHLRDWSYEPVGIKNDDGTTALDCVLSISEIISLRKRTKNIEYIVSESKKSPLLNKSSSSTPKDADKESSSSTCTVKNSAEESTITQKEIDDMYRSTEKKVFGRDKDRKLICRMLREGPDANAASSSTSKSNSVIGIYGITGSGKSTLAQYVCEHEKSAGHFNLIMFVLVGKTFSIGDIFREMLDQIKQQRPSVTNAPASLKTEFKVLRSLKTELKAELNGKCFLLVLDDLWVNANNMKERRILLDVLDAGQRGSRILVTAQKKDAAAALGAQPNLGEKNTDHLIPIPDLEEEQYLSMFVYYALEGSQLTRTDYDRYKEIARKITKKLSRSPIAAITVAARLKSNSSIKFWDTTANLDVLNETMGALWWSYQQLGVDIRRCFAYCSTFPKGYALDRDELVRIWIAQGFVNTTSNAAEEVEDIGQSYFDQLLTFSFLQVQRTFFLGTVEFTIHDLLHDLAERVSGSEFFRIDLNNGSAKDIPQGVRHLFIETKNAAEIINEKILDLGNLRTLIINEDPHAEHMQTIERNHDLEKAMGRLFMRLKKLRVLIIKVNFYTGEFSVSASIDQMKYLRYLGFNFQHGLLNLILPSTFSKLYHIQVIDIPSFNEVSCPEGMANLIYLRHISASLSFPDVGRLTSLQTLVRFIVKEDQGYELKQLMHLNKLQGTLRIWGLGIVGSKEEALEAHLTHKERLRELQLEFCNSDPNVEVEVLEGLCPPKDLQELEIRNYMGSRYPSWMLSRHHPDAPKQLHKLELFNCSQLASIPEDSQLFISLCELEIFQCDWDSLPQNMKRLVSLQKLVIRWCDKMERLPTLPQSLERISIYRCDVLSKTCNEEGHGNWCKIRYIPEKEII